MARKPEVPQPEVKEPEAAAVATADIVITAAHVFLPFDEDGNVPVNWRDVPGRIDELDLSPAQKVELAAKYDTRPVERRTRLTVPADLAAFLSERDQAEVL